MANNDIEQNLTYSQDSDCGCTSPGYGNSNGQGLGKNLPLNLSTVEMNKYLLIGTTSNDIAKAVNVQNGDLGADIVVLSTEIDDNVDFDLDDVFLHNAGSQWVDVDNKHSADSSNIGPDYLPGAAQVGEGVSWTGDVALTSTNAAFDMSNVELYGQVGVVAASNNPASSVSNTEYFSDGLGDGYDTTGDGLAMPSNGVTTDTAAMTALLTELDAFEEYVTNLAPEVKLTPGNGLPTSQGIEDVDYFELNVDQYDTNGDGIAVIDIEVGGGSDDFKLTNSNWVIESENGTFAIFRILGDSNLVLNQSTIVMGDGVLGNSNATSPSGPTEGLGAIFIKAYDYNDGQGGRNDGEALDSGDTTFSFNDTVLNGVGFYDLIEFSRDDDSNGNDQAGILDFDLGTTELKINNGQGCSHFISPKINFNNVRFEHCLGGGGEPLASLGDYVWLDSDLDGIQDSNEAGIGGVLVTLTGGGADGVIGTGNDDTTDTTTTDGTGFYEFIDLNPGEEYQVTFSAPSGYVFTSQDAGSDDGIDSDADPTTGESQIVILAPGENNPTIDAGLYQLASLGDYVWEDSDVDGIQDNDEAGIGGVLVTLTGGGADGVIGTADDTTDTTTTLSNGFYEFTGLNPGEQYQVTFSAPTDYFFTSQDVGNNDGIDSDADPATGESQIVILASGEHNPTIDAGLYQLESLGDYVWEDSDLDGIQDSDEAGIGGVLVTLTGGGADGVIGTADDT
ncbi:MAG: SdrD B-like domain-containing protein, partial [Microcystaceae cyanobacterium]